MGLPVVARLRAARSAKETDLVGSDLEIRRLSLVVTSVVLRPWSGTLGVVDGQLGELEDGLGGGVGYGGGDGGGGLGAAGDGGLGEGGVAELDLDELGVHVEGGGGGLGDHGVHALAEFLASGACGDLASGADADDGLGGGAVGGVGGGGHAYADEVVAFKLLAGFGVAFGPAEALCACL